LRCKEMQLVLDGEYLSGIFYLSMFVEVVLFILGDIRRIFLNDHPIK
jgi:hypothetical protein